MKRALVVTVAVLCLEPRAQAQFDELNLSTDLVRLGIASHNMVPDRRELDSGPAFNAALDYVKRHGVRRVTLHPGRTTSSVRGPTTAPTRLPMAWRT